MNILDYIFTAQEIEKLKASGEAHEVIYKSFKCHDIIDYADEKPIAARTLAGSVRTTLDYCIDLVLYFEDLQSVSNSIAYLTIGIFIIAYILLFHISWRWSGLLPSIKTELNDSSKEGGQFGTWSLYCVCMLPYYYILLFKQDLLMVFAPYRYYFFLTIGVMITIHMLYILIIIILCRCRRSS